LVIAGKPSKLEVHSLNEIVETFRDKEIMFLIHCREKKDDLLQFLAANKFEFTTIADPKSILAADVFHILGYPTSIVIDRTSKIKYYSLGSD